MARIFISHSSRDNDAAARMKAWLDSQGFGDTFLDTDKTEGIPPGGEWEKTLYRRVEQSQAVIIIQTTNWRASNWCFAEFAQARAQGKAIFPVIETPTDGARIAPDIQALDLTGDREGGLERLSAELKKIALGAGGFKWDASRPPFPGLLAFQEGDAAIYFGRDDDIRRLIERLDARRTQGGARLIALLGSSGSGKSSLLRAGVIPRLKRTGRNWIVAPPIRPAQRPVEALAVALAAAKGPDADWRKLKDNLTGPDSKRTLDDFANDLRVKAGASEAQILIPIDQAEELFGVADSDEARRFLEILSYALSEDLPFLAVMALRSDYLGELQSAESLTARFEEFSLAPMPLARIPQIIQGPARVAGINVDDEFVQQVARDAETEDALPLLAFALRRLSDHSVDRSLTLNGYRALGDEKAGLTPLENAVRKTADEVLAEAKPADDELMALRDAFVPAMVRLNDQDEYVRRPARWDELPAKAQPLLERLAKARLLIVRHDGDVRVVEVAHEALLRKWPLLRSWLDAAREFLIGKQQLERDLHDWRQATETDKAGALLTGLKLNHARGWLIEHPTQLTAQERTFIQASIEQVETDDRRKARTRRLVTLGSLATAFVLAVVTGWAVWEAQTAKAAQKAATESEQQARAAQKSAIANESRALMALSQTANAQGHSTDAAKLALAAWPRSAADQRLPLSGLIEQLVQTFRGPLEISPPLQHEGSVNSAAFSPDGKQVVTASQDKTARVWDAATGAQMGKPMRHEGSVNSAAFSPDGKQVVTASSDKTARVWDAATGVPGKPMQHEGDVNSAAFSPDGKRVVTASDDKTARLWDAATGAPIGKPMQHEGSVYSAAFSPDGKRVVTASDDKTAQVWDAENGEPIGKPIQHGDTVYRAAFSPDSKWVVTVSGNAAWVWNAATGAQIGEPLLHEGAVVSAAFSPGSRLVVTASKDKTARVWNVLHHETIGEPMRHDGWVVSAKFSPGGERVVTASRDGTARVWNVTTGAPIGNSMGHYGNVIDAEFNPDATRVVTASADQTARVWDATAGAPIGKPMQHDSDVLTAAFSPDGKRVVTASYDKTARVWDAENGEPIGKPIRHEDAVNSAAFSPDGKRVVTASEDKTARLSDAATGAPIGKPMQHEDTVYTAAFSPDGKRVVTASHDKTARVWDAATGTPIGKPIRHEDAVNSAAFSPDGRRIVTRSGETARVWDAATGGPIGKPMQHEETVWSATFSPDGQQVLTTSGNALGSGAARVWDAATGTPIGQSMQHDRFVRSAAFSPDGKRVVTASDDKTARVWDAATGAPIGKPFDHKEKVFKAEFSPDGTRVVTASYDKTAQVWDLATGAPIGPPLVHGGAVTSAAFGPDGAVVVTVSRNRTARVWTVPPVAPNVVATACKMLRDHDMQGIFTRYGVDVKEPICTGNEPAPDRARMIDR